MEPLASTVRKTSEMPGCSKNRQSFPVSEAFPVAGAVSPVRACLGLKKQFLIDAFPHRGLGLGGTFCSSGPCGNRTQSAVWGNAFRRGSHLPSARRMRNVSSSGSGSHTPAAAWGGAFGHTALRGTVESIGPVGASRGGARPRVKRPYARLLSHYPSGSLPQWGVA